MRFKGKSVSEKKLPKLEIKQSLKLRFKGVE